VSQGVTVSGRVQARSAIQLRGVSVNAETSSRKRATTPASSGRCHPNVVGRWATFAGWQELIDAGLSVFAGMTAGAWQYIGSQGILQGTYETFMAAGRKHFGGSLSGRLVLTAGLGGMGGAQPLAGVLAGAATLVVEVDPERVDRRLREGYLQHRSDDLDEALALVLGAKDKGEAISVGLVDTTGHARSLLSAALAAELALGDRAVRAVDSGIAVQMGLARARLRVLLLQCLLELPLHLIGCRRRRLLVGAHAPTLGAASDARQGGGHPGCC